MKAADPIRVITKIRNNRLMQAREQLGLSVKQFAIKANVTHSHYNSIENLSKLPSEMIADRIAAAAGVTVDTLFPQYLGSIKANKTIRTIPEEDLLSLQDAERLQLPSPEYPPDEALIVQESIQQSLETLPPRYQSVLRMRFGLGSVEPPLTLEQIAVRMDLTRERVRQIEATALRKLRHPSCSSQLRGLLGLL